MKRPAGLKRPRAVLFDWDNTLVNTWPTIVECYHDTFTALGQTPWTAHEVRNRAHGSLRDVFPGLFGAARRRGGEGFLRDVLPHPSGAAGAAAGRRRPAGRAAMSSAAMSPSSATRWATISAAELAHLGWQRWISRAVGARDAQRDKPAPDPIFLALDGTGIAPDETVWMVGDTPADLKCAYAAGCLPVLMGELEQLSDGSVGITHRVSAHVIVMSWWHCFEPSVPYICSNSVAGR